MLALIIGFYMNEKDLPSIFYFALCELFIKTWRFDAI